MHRTGLLIIFLFSQVVVSAQYPFEKYPAVKDKVYINWKKYDRLEKKGKIDYTLTIPGFFSNKDTLSLQVTAYSEHIDSSCLRVFHNRSQIKKYTDYISLGLGSYNYPDSAYVGDFNGDGLNDIKFYVPNHGCGAYNYYTQVIYLFQKPDGEFDKISFTDLFYEFEYRKERDIDGDGNFEIITQSFRSHGGHSYWLFNIYKFKNGDLINCNELDDYPIMVQILYRDNFEITNKIPREDMKKFSQKLPDDYNRK